MISYCICTYRARYFYLVVEDLIRKTSCKYEILVWINTRAPDLEPYVQRLVKRGVPIRIVGITQENIGMVGFRDLFRSARYELIVQVDDDVLAISRGIGQIARSIFRRDSKVKQLVANVIQDPFTTGARPSADAYKPYNKADGLYDGPIDGWFSVYHSSIRDVLLDAPYEKFFYLGSHMWLKLKSLKLVGALCTRFKVFHACGPAYAQLFDMLPFEIKKYAGLGSQGMAEAYQKAVVNEGTLNDIRSQFLKNIAHLETWGEWKPKAKSKGCLFGWFRM